MNYQMEINDNQTAHENIFFSTSFFIKASLEPKQGKIHKRPAQELYRDQMFTVLPLQLIHEISSCIFFLSFVLSRYVVIRFA